MNEQDLENIALEYYKHARRLVKIVIGFIGFDRQETILFCLLTPIFLKFQIRNFTP